MTKFETLSVVLAAIAAIISIVAVFLAGRANSLNKNMFRRQGVIDLHMAWQGINHVDKNNLIAADIVRSVHALALTASLWNHDIIEKNILYQTYWTPYKELYEEIYSIDALIPGHKRTCKSLITTEIQKAYEGMRTADLGKVTQTKL